MQHPRFQLLSRVIPRGIDLCSLLRDVQQTPATAEARPLRRVLHLPRAREPVVPFCHASRIRMKSNNHIFTSHEDSAVVRRRGRVNAGSQLPPPRRAAAP